MTHSRIMVICSSGYVVTKFQRRAQVGWMVANKAHRNRNDSQFACRSSRCVCAQEIYILPKLWVCRRWVAALGTDMSGTSAACSAQTSRALIYRTLSRAHGIIAAHYVKIAHNIRDMSPPNFRATSEPLSWQFAARTEISGKKHGRALA